MIFNPNFYVESVATSLCGVRVQETTKIQVKNTSFGKLAWANVWRVSGENEKCKFKKIG